MCAATPPSPHTPLQAFARHCRKLRELNLADCKAISDVGILQISNHCFGLEFLDVSRKELAYKITDIALLALGERCHELNHLNLQGCNFVTDVGLNWLAGGCHNLMYLNLSGLYKITDTGARQSTPSRGLRPRFLPA